MEDYYSNDVCNHVGWKRCKVHPAKERGMWLCSIAMDSKFMGRCHGGHYFGLPITRSVVQFQLPTLINDIVFEKISSRAHRHKPARRNILLWKHANFDDIRLKITNWARDIISSNITFTPVENLATNITDSLSKIVSDYVLSKFSTRMLEQCWTSSSLLFFGVHPLQMTTTSSSKT